MRATPILLFLPLLACEPISLGGDKYTGHSVGSADDIAQLCAEQTPKSVDIEVAFDEWADSCPWDEGDNLSQDDGYFTARVETTEALSMPTDSVICDVAYNFQVDPEETQIMRYDDHFALNFVDVVLASSNAQIAGLLPETDGLRMWDWSAVAGEAIDWNDTNSWCLGQEEGLSDCTIPPTDTPGEMTLDYDASLVADLSYRAMELNRVDFTFVTIGDNDPSTDCSHNAFSFMVSVDYIQQ